MTGVYSSCPELDMNSASAEAERLRALERYDTVDIAGDQAFEQLVQLAAQVCDMPVATLSLVDGTHQHFRVRIGLDLASTPREQAICVHTMARRDVLLVSDASADDRFADNPLVLGGPRVRAYAGAPLITDDGHALGTLCVIDTVPRELTAMQQQSLRILASHAMGQLELRRTLREADAQRQALAVATLERRRILDQSVDVLSVLDGDGRFVEVSQAAYEVWGRAPETLVGRNWADLVHPDDLGISFDHVREVMRGKGTAFHVENRCVHADGHAVWMRWSSRWSSEDARAYSVARDITQQKAAEQVLIESEARLREQAALLEMANDAILTRDMTGAIRFWNPAATRLFGWAADEVLGRRTVDVLENDAARYDQAMTSLRADHAWQGELPRATRDGRVLTVQSHWTLIASPDGVPTGVLEINTDVTAARQTQAQSLRAQRLESLGTLASGIAHDLNNMLAPILMSVDVLRGSVHDDLGREVLQAIEASATKGANLVRQVQSFARGADGERAEVRVDVLVADIARIVGETFPRSINVRTEVDAAGWVVMGDATQLQQVLLNLAVNARDAMDGHGSLVIRTVSDEEVEAAALAVQVIDTGCGMSAEVLERVFDPFYTTKPAGQGTGLGMSQVFAFCRQSGGEVKIQSTEGEGTRVAMLLPVAKPAITGGEKDLSDGAPSLAGPGERLNILVVEDDHRVLAATVEAVAELGHKAVPCSNPLEAEALVESQGDFDLILSDVLMPELTGPEMVARLKQRWPELSVLFVTGFAGDAGDDASFGDHDVLRKPFTLTALDRAIRRSNQPRAAEDQRLAS